jgi:hypothetical protein
MMAFNVLAPRLIVLPGKLLEHLGIGFDDRR